MVWRRRPHGKALSGRPWPSTLAALLECGMTPPTPPTNPRTSTLAQFSTTVVVRPLPEQTDAAQQLYGFAYTVTVRNSGTVAAQLIARHWVINDHRGGVQQVRGLGVVGHQPLLKPGEQFEYTSWAQISTAQGSMHGLFIGITDDARWFESPVAEFALVDAASLH